MNKNIAYDLSIILFAFFLMSAKCTHNLGEKEELLLNNNSSDTILFHGDFRSPSDTLLPDYTFYYNNEVKNAKIICPNSSIVLEKYWKHLFHDRDISDFQYKIFYFKKSVVDSVPWDQIVAEYQIIKRYDLSYEDLTNLNWTISFP
jgi:hypothetical protein